MDSKKKPKQRTGVPLFDRETTDRICEEALRTGDVPATAERHGTSQYNLYRWIRKYKARKGLVASDDRSNVPTAGVGAQYRVSPSQSSEVERLQAELREAYATIGRLTVERDKLKGRS